jgi:transposase
MIRVLLVGYVFALRSERRLCSEVQVNLAYRWFCKLDDKVPQAQVQEDANSRDGGSDVPDRKPP